jgi:hypothetical protein
VIKERCASVASSPHGLPDMRCFKEEGHAGDHLYGSNHPSRCGKRVRMPDGDLRCSDSRGHEGPCFAVYRADEEQYTGVAAYADSMGTSQESLMSRKMTCAEFHGWPRLACMKPKGHEGPHGCEEQRSVTDLDELFRKLNVLYSTAITSLTTGALSSENFNLEFDKLTEYYGSLREALKKGK